MSTVGQIEKKTQARVVKLFRDTLGYDYLGDWEEREGNASIEEDLLSAWLKKQGVDEALITRALHLLAKAAGDTSKSLYDRNRAVYDLLRYGVKVKPDVGETHADRLADRLEAPGEEPLRHRRGGHRHRQQTPRPTRSGRTWCSTSTASPSACWS